MKITKIITNKQTRQDPVTVSFSDLSRHIVLRLEEGLEAKRIAYVDPKIETGLPGQITI